mmetsp:Transcript_45571/g.74243  ORF Transcript_45571/g.74243 Transcript_45571/m.74243 type:complete len:98 (-) Transcript_45571:1123-1416(-)
MVPTQTQDDVPSHPEDQKGKKKSHYRPEGDHIGNTLVVSKPYLFVCFTVTALALTMSSTAKEGQVPSKAVGKELPPGQGLFSSSCHSMGVYCHSRRS